MIKLKFGGTIHVSRLKKLYANVLFTGLYMIQVMGHAPDDHRSPAGHNLIYNNNILEGASRMYHGAKHDEVKNGKFNN